MNILIIAPPILKSNTDKDSWLTVPPLGYGGIENVIDALVNGLIYHGCIVTIIGVPGSHSINGLTVIRNVRRIEDIRVWIDTNWGMFDIIHDHSGGLIYGSEKMDFKYVATHHKTGKSPYPQNTVCLSNAQKSQANLVAAPVIRLPIVFQNYIFDTQKSEYYLFLGRVSEFKGVLEAARICEKLKVKLIVAGPAWEAQYFQRLTERFAKTIQYEGNVYGLKKIDLLSKAKGVFVLSRFSEGPWRDDWCEPGATVVGEAAASGTPVISSTNGCLSELVVQEIGVQLDEFEIESADLSKLEHGLPNPSDVFNYAQKNWNHISISEQYLVLYRQVINGFIW